MVESPEAIHKFSEIYFSKITEKLGAIKYTYYRPYRKICEITDKHNELKKYSDILTKLTDGNEASISSENSSVIQSAFVFNFLGFVSGIENFIVNSQNYEILDEIIKQVPRIASYSTVENFNDRCRESIDSEISNKHDQIQILREKLQKMREANEDLRKAYEKQLSDIRASLGNAN